MTGYKHRECSKCGTEIGFSEVFIMVGDIVTCTECDRMSTVGHRSMICRIRKGERRLVAVRSTFVKTDIGQRIVMPMQFAYIVGLISDIEAILNVDAEHDVSNEQCTIERWQDDEACAMVMSAPWDEITDAILDAKVIE